MHPTFKKGGKENDVQVEVLRFVCCNVAAIVLYLMRRFGDYWQTTHESKGSVLWRSLRLTSGPQQGYSLRKRAISTICAEKEQCGVKDVKRYVPGCQPHLTGPVRCPPLNLVQLVNKKRQLDPRRCMSTTITVILQLCCDHIVESIRYG